MYVYAYNMEGHKGGDPAEVGTANSIDQLATTLLVSPDLYDRETYLLLRLAVVDIIRTALAEAQPGEPGRFVIPDINILCGVIREV